MWNWGGMRRDIDLTEQARSNHRAGETWLNLLKWLKSEPLSGSMSHFIYILKSGSLLSHHIISIHSKCVSV